MMTFFFHFSLVTHPQHYITKDTIYYTASGQHPNLTQTYVLIFFVIYSFYSGDTQSNTFPNTLIITIASAWAIIKVSGHQHQWFPSVSQVVTM